jgi:hypothetical protein
MQQPLGEDMAAAWWKRCSWGSAQSWISSTATNSAPRSSGIASTVQAYQRAPGGTIFSSPVISATLRAPLRATIRS